MKVVWKSASVDTGELFAMIILMLVKHWLCVDSFLATILVHNLVFYCVCSIGMISICFKGDNLMYNVIMDEIM